MARSIGFHQQSGCDFGIYLGLQGVYVDCFVRIPLRHVSILRNYWKLFESRPMSSKQSAAQNSIIVLSMPWLLLAIPNGNQTEIVKTC